MTARIGYQIDDRVAVSCTTQDLPSIGIDHPCVFRTAVGPLSAGIHTLRLAMRVEYGEVLLIKRDSTMQIARFPIDGDSHTSILPYDYQTNVTTWHTINDLSITFETIENEQVTLDVFLVLNRRRFPQDTGPRIDVITDENIPEDSAVLTSSHVLSAGQHTVKLMKSKTVGVFKFKLRSRFDDLIMGDENEFKN